MNRHCIPVRHQLRIDINHLKLTQDTRYYFMMDHEKLEPTTTLEAVNSGTNSEKLQKIGTLGSVRLQNAQTKEIILVPQPSSDPNDPLNWSRGFRYYQAVIVCLAMVMCNFLAAGPSVAIVDITIDYFGPPGPEFVSQISKIAYFFTTTALL